MSKTKIPHKTLVHLWTKAAGRCQYDGCNSILWRDELDLADMNKAYVAHIVADSEGGPRGDHSLSPKLAKSISNLMLMCDTHHRKIDTEQVAEHPVERLETMKRIHEKRIENLTGILPDKKTEILLYGANIGKQNVPLSAHQAIQAVVPYRYPLSTSGIELSMKNSSFTDSNSKFWEIEELHLREMFQRHVKPRLADGSLNHLSIFALAPQPLLILLGSLLSDIQDSDVYQLQREPKFWGWGKAEQNNFKIIKPTNPSGAPALIISISGTIDLTRIQKVDPNLVPWVLTIDKPNNDFIKSRDQLAEFRKILRSLLDEIKSIHGQNAVIHTFPAMPISTAIDLGRVLMPKADLPLKIYDQNYQTNDFSFALEINTRGATA